MVLGLESEQWSVGERICDKVGFGSEDNERAVRFEEAVELGQHGGIEVGQISLLVVEGPGWIGDDSGERLIGEGQIGGVELADRDRAG